MEQVNFSVTEEEMELADIFHGRGEANRSERERLEGLRVFQLRNELRERGLDPEGTPAEMVERLLAVSDEDLADADFVPTKPADPKPPGSSSLRASMELVRRSGSEVINPVASSPRWWPAGGAVELIDSMSADGPERDENGMLVLNNDLQVAEHNVHLRKEIQKLRQKVDRLTNAVEKQDQPELRLALESSREKLLALETRQRLRFMPVGNAKVNAEQQPKGPDVVSFGSAKDRGLSTPRALSPRIAPKREVSQQKEVASTLSSEIGHKHRAKSPAPGTLSPRGFGTQAPTFRGQHAFGVPWGTSADNRPSMLPPSDVIVAAADGGHQVISAVVGAGGTGQLAPVGLDWRQYYRLLRDRSYAPGPRPMKTSRISERTIPKGTLYKETMVRRDSDAALWKLQDGAPAGKKALHTGTTKIQAGVTFEPRDYVDLTMKCQCTTEERSGTPPERLLQLLCSNQEKMPCAPGCCRVAGVGVRERVGMLMRENGMPREPPVYFAQYTLLRRKPTSVPVRQKGRGSSPLASSITNIRLSVTDAAAAEDKPYVFDADDFEEEDEKTRTTLFHLAAESHASGMRSSTRQETEHWNAAGQIVKGVFPDRAPRCADMGIRAGSDSNRHEDDGRPLSFQDHTDPFYPQAVSGHPASNPNDMKVARSYYHYTKPSHLRHRHHREQQLGTGERPKSAGKKEENDSSLATPADDVAASARKRNSTPPADLKHLMQPTHTTVGKGGANGSVAHSVWESSDYVPQESFGTGMFRYACDIKFDEMRKHMWAQTFAIGSNDMADLFDMYDRNGDGFLDRAEFYRAIRRSRVSSKELSHEAVHALFDSLDTSGDGLVSAMELRDFMESKGIKGITAVPNQPKSRPGRTQPQLVDEKLRTLLQTYHQKQQRSWQQTRTRGGSGDGANGGSVPMRRQKSMPSAPADRRLASRFMSNDSQLPDSVTLDLPQKLHPAGYARVFATELADSPRGLAPHVITPQMALAVPEEREKPQRGARYREQKQKNLRTQVRPDRNADATNTDSASTVADEKTALDSAREESLSSSVTFAYADSGTSKGVEAAPGSCDGVQDPSLSLDPSLQQGMIEYVADLRDLLGAQLITQDEFTQWVLRKAGGAVLEQQLKEIADEEAE